MEWVEGEGASEKEALAKVMAELGEDNRELLVCEELKVTRRFMGMGGRVVKLRARRKTDEELAADAPVGEKEDKAKVASDPDADTPYMAKLRAREADESAPESDDSAVGDMKSSFSPWEVDGEPGVVIPPRGRGFRNRLYSDLPPEPGSQSKPKPKKSREKKRGGPSQRDKTYAVEERIDTVQYDEESFVPPVYEDASDSPISESDRDAAITFVKETVSNAGINAEVIAWRLSDRLLIQVSSDSGGLLIGRRGETIDSLQYLTEIVVNKGIQGRFRVVVDTEHYRERRMDKMAFLAKRAADDAERTNRSISLNPMNATERRIVHMTLADDTRVATVSEGAGPRRRVVVHPAGKKQEKSGGGRGGRGGGGNR